MEIAVALIHLNSLPIKIRLSTFAENRRRFFLGIDLLEWFQMRARACDFQVFFLNLKVKF